MLPLAAHSIARSRAATGKTRFTPTQRTLVAALTLRATRPRAPSSRMRPVTRRLHIALADGSLVAATAAPRYAFVNSARSHPKSAASTPAHQVLGSREKQIRQAGPTLFYLEGI